MEQTARIDRGESAAKISAICICIAPAVFALLTFQHPFAMTPMRTFGVPLVITEIFVIALAVYAGFRPLSALQKIPKDILAALGVWLLVGIANGASAPVPGMTYFHLGLLIVHLLFAIALFDRLCENWRASKRTLVGAFGLGLALYVVILQSLAVFASSLSDFNWRNIGAGAIHVRHLAFFGGALVGLSLGVLATACGRRTRILAMIGLFLGYYLCAWSGGRNQFLVCIVGTVAMAVIFARRDFLRFVASCAAIAAVAMPLTLLTAPPDSYYGLGAVIERSGLASGDSLQTINYRWNMWQDTFHAALRERPLIGHGRNSFEYTVREGVFHPHNLLLQLFYNWGVIGSMAIGYLGLAALLRSSRWVSIEPDVAVPTLGSLLFLLLLSGVDGPFFFPWPLMAAALCAGILCSIQPTRPDATPL